MKNPNNLINPNMISNTPTVPFIEGDGIGREITAAMREAIDYAVYLAYGSSRKINREEVLAWGKAIKKWLVGLPKDTIEKIRHYGVGIKGPMETAVGKGARSYNVALRQELDLYACVRPVEYFEGAPSPLRNPHGIDMCIFRENTEGDYAGLGYPGDSQIVKEIIEVLARHGQVLPEGSGIDIGFATQAGSKRLVKATAEYANRYGYKKLTMAHKGNIKKFTEGSFKNWWYDVLKSDFRDIMVTERESWILSNAEKYPRFDTLQYARLLDSNYDNLLTEQQVDIQKEIETTLSELRESHGNGKWKTMLLVNDKICDNAFQLSLQYPQQFGVLATTNLNGDYMSDFWAAMVGWLGISWWANINYQTGLIVPEATHGTAPDKAGRGIANPLSLILSAMMFLRHIGWDEAADILKASIRKQVASQHVTVDFYNQIVAENAPKTFKQKIIREYRKLITPNVLEKCVNTNQFTKELCRNMESVASLN